MAKNKKKKQPLIAFVIGGVVLCLLLLLGGAYWWLDWHYQDKVYPRIYVGKYNLGGKTYLQALEILDNAKKDFDNNGFTFTYQNAAETIPTTLIKDETSGLSVDLLTITSQATADQAYQYGKNSFWQKIKLLFAQQKISLFYDLNEAELTDALEDRFAQFENPAQDAQLTFTSDDTILVTEEKSGEAFPWKKILVQINENIKNLDNAAIALALETDNPELKKADTADLVEQTEKLLAPAPLTLVYQDDTWTFNKEDLEPWLMFSVDGLILNKVNTETSLKTIAKEIDQPVQEGKFSVTTKEDGTVDIQQFQEGKDGLELQITDTINKLQTTWIDGNKNNIEIVMAVTKPKVSPSNIADLGIKDLLGTGYTNFSGSPYNRILNIKKGADILNGLLIAPGETFSLVGALGHIDGEHGWLPELVIKENKTIPEYGGGLCQIGTTTFRAAMMSGSEIVERQNHSYVVSYYNYKGKPGVDATIYEPKPDMRFTNDTGHYILWQTRVEGADLYFDFWGTTDGRKGYFTDPVNFNAVSAPDPIITETEDLEPGEMVCSEKSHNGLSASFDYIIEWPDGHQDTQTFTSVYKALPSVCQKGKEVVEETPVVNTNTNTSNNNTNNSNTNKKKNKKQSL